MTTTPARRMAIDGNSYPPCDACGQYHITLTPLPWTDEHGQPQTAMVCPDCHGTTQDVGGDTFMQEIRRHF